MPPPHRVCAWSLPDSSAAPGQARGFYFSQAPFMCLHFSRVGEQISQAEQKAAPPLTFKDYCGFEIAVFSRAD